MSKKKPETGPKVPKTIENRKARHDYEIFDTFEAGLVLVGSEVKSLFAGRANLTDAYVKVVGGEAWVHEFDIEPYPQAAHFKPERRRDRKLLLHKKEIATIDRKSQEKGFTLVPLKVYFKDGKAKLLFGLARGKKQYDKREQLKKDETRREMERMRGTKRG